MSDPEGETRASKDDGRREDQTRTATGDRAGVVLERIGPYRLLEVLGEGGMGVVYHAEQVEPVVRRVALKIIKLGEGNPEVAWNRVRLAGVLVLEGRASRRRRGCFSR